MCSCCKTAHKEMCEVHVIRSNSHVVSLRDAHNFIHLNTTWTKAGTPGIALLYGWSHASLPLVHAFHMWKRFTFSLRFTVCLWKDHSAEKTEAVRTGWSSMKILIVLLSNPPTPERLQTSTLLLKQWISFLHFFFFFFFLVDWQSLKGENMDRVPPAAQAWSAGLRYSGPFAMTL